MELFNNFNKLDNFSDLPGPARCLRALAWVGPENVEIVEIVEQFHIGEGHMSVEGENVESGKVPLDPPIPPASAHT